MDDYFFSNAVLIVYIRVSRKSCASCTWHMKWIFTNNKYTSENITGILIDLFRDYRIVGNIGYFIANNTELNDIYINTILCVLYLNISAKLYKGRQLYYFSYIINFYTQAFIIRNNIKGVYKELARAYYKIDFKKVKKL